MGPRLGGVSHTPQPIREMGSTIGEASILACSIGSEWPGDNDLLLDEQVGSACYRRAGIRITCQKLGKSCPSMGEGC